MSQQLPIRISFRINDVYLTTAILLDQVPRVGDLIDFQLFPVKMFKGFQEGIGDLDTIGTVTTITWGPVQVHDKPEDHQWYVTVDTHHEQPI